MGLISRVSSRTYRNSKIIFTKNMAKGARNKKRKACSKIRREIFDPRIHDKVNKITPDLERLQAAVQQKRESNLAFEDEAAIKEKQKFDEFTKKDKNGTYAPWLSQKECKKLIKVNNKLKTRKKNDKKQKQKKLKKLANTVAGRAAIE